MSVHDDYLSTLNEAQKTLLGHVRTTIKNTVPEADEVMGYGMPVFKYKGKYLIGYCAFKQHMSVFPGAEAIADLEPVLHGYKTAKGTVQFTADKPLSDQLLVKIVTHRLNAIDSTNK